MSKFEKTTLAPAGKLDQRKKEEKEDEKNYARIFDMEKIRGQETQLHGEGARKRKIEDERGQKLLEKYQREKEERERKEQEEEKQRELQEEYERENNPNRQKIEANEKKILELKQLISEYNQTNRNKHSKQSFQELLHDDGFLQVSEWRRQVDLLEDENAKLEGYKHGKERVVGLSGEYEAYKTIKEMEEYAKKNGGKFDQEKYLQSLGDDPSLADILGKAHDLKPNLQKKSFWDKVSGIFKRKPKKGDISESNVRESGLLER